MSFYCTISKLTKKQSKKISNIQDIDLFFEERDKHDQILELGDLILKVKRKNQEILFNEDDCKIIKIQKTGLRDIIEFMRSEIEKNYKKEQSLLQEIMIRCDKNNKATLSADQMYSLIKLKDKLTNRSTEWDKNHPMYNLDTNKSLTDSGTFEYLIFDLISIYKHFDFETSDLVAFCS